MWEVRTKTVLDIIGALGTINNGLYKKLQLLPGHPLATGLKKFTIMSTEHVIHKVVG